MFLPGLSVYAISKKSQTRVTIYFFFGVYHLYALKKVEKLWADPSETVSVDNSYATASHCLLMEVNPYGLL